jgi:hypothetical protein
MEEAVEDVEAGLDVIEDANSGNPTCPICLNILLAQKTCNELACKHAFCTDCIIKWAKTQEIQGSRRLTTCPICRKEIRPNLPHVNHEKDYHRCRWVCVFALFSLICILTYFYLISIIKI